MSERTCAVCGAMVSQPWKGRPRKYCLGCSPRRRLMSGPPPARPTPALTLRPCDQCGQTISGRPDRRFCGLRCKSQWHAARKPSMAVTGPRPCQFCGWTFFATNAGHRFCSQQCAWAQKGLQDGRRFSCGRFTVILWSDCADCGRTWPSTFAQASRCPSCSVSHRRAVKRMRNAFRRGAPSISGQVVTDSEIFERDGWRCQLCGDPVLPFIKGLHPRQASIDHIVPVSKGGEHVQRTCSWPISGATPPSAIGWWCRATPKVHRLLRSRLHPVGALRVPLRRLPRPAEAASRRRPFSRPQRDRRSRALCDLRAAASPR